MKTLIRRILIFCFSLVILLAAADLAAACSCRPPGTVLEKFANSENVGVFKLRSVETALLETDTTRVRYTKSATFIVEKVFKGKLQAGRELVFQPGGGGDCLWNYRKEMEGTDYLLYLYGDADEREVWGVSMCSGSRPAKYLPADLYYLEKMVKMRGKTRLSGTLTQSIETAREDGVSSREPLAAKTVNIKGRGRNVRLKTDKNGVYEIYGLPPGKYTVTPENVIGYKPYQLHRGTAYEKEIKAGGHAEQDFTYEIDNTISGRLFDTAGNPLPDVTLDLLPAEGEPDEHLYFKGRVTTDKEGKFEFEDVPAETYVIAVNAGGKVSADMPFGAFYYPGKMARDEARTITVGPGEVIENLTITAPEEAERVTIAGVLMYEDGKPVARRWVEYYEEKNVEARKGRYIEPDARTRTDDKGRFSLKVLKGQKGVIVGTVYEFQQSDRPCPKMDAILGRMKSGGGTLETPEIFIDASSDQLEYELRFPFPQCKSRD